MEAYLLIPLFGGLSIVLGAWAWLLVCAFRQGLWWGFVCLIMPPLALWFAARHAQQAIAPLVLVVAGGFLVTAPALYLLVVPAPETLQKTSSHESRLRSLTSKALRSDLVHEWVESRAYFLQVGAIPVIACAWTWLLVRAFRQRRAWGWASLILPPVGLAFAARILGGSCTVNLADIGGCGCDGAGSLYSVCSGRSWSAG